MLKKCYGLVLGLMVLTGSACVTPTHASSAYVVIAYIRAGGTTSAVEEGVVLYNNSSFEVTINDWCLTNKAAIKFACIMPSDGEQIVLPGYSYATIVSTSAATNIQPNAYASIYESVNHTSGAIVASSDIISLLDSTGQLVDQHSWSSSLSSSQQWSRMKLTAEPDIFLDNNSASDWQKQTYSTFPISEIEHRFSDVEEPKEPTDPEIPEELVEPIEIPTLLPAIITELLPNAIGSDTGNEFIEIYNPNEFNTISVEGYVLAIGPAFEKKITLGNHILQPKEYKALTNVEYSYSLLNTSSRVSLTTKEGVVSSEVPPYDSPPDGEAWSLIDDIWQYTKLPTPGTINALNIVTDELESEDSEISTPKPCAANQYRNPETNRCRLLTLTAATTPAECKVGQERNPVTNRCRNIASSTAASCKEGQERNTETNRCRNIKQLAKTDFAVKGASTQQQGGLGWYIWAAIGGVVMLIIGYAIWEWRDELKSLYVRIKAKFAGTVN